MRAGICRNPLAAVLLSVICLMLSMHAAAQTKDAEDAPAQIKRLILTDGSYESISQFAVQGDRIRYYSTERNAWEELPYSLVDWQATKEFTEQASANVATHKKMLMKKAENEQRRNDVRMPQIASGMRLPSQGGVYLLDAYQGNAGLVPLSQNGADVKKNVKNNILRGLINPVASSRHTIELPGLHARIQAHAQTPEIYFFIDPDDAGAGYASSNAGEYLRIVRCGNKKNNRLVMTWNIAVYGKVTEKAQYIETVVEPASEYWVKVTPARQLEPGEYALVEFDVKGAMNQFVWDFGVNPQAPPNAVLQSKSGNDAPVLIEKDN